LALGLVMGVGALALLALFSRPLSLLFLAFCIAAAFAPLAARLSKRLPRGLAIILLYVLLVAFLVIVLALLLAPLIRELRAFIERLPQFLERGQELLTQFGISEAQVESFTAQAGQIGQGLVGVPLSILSGALDAVLVLIVSLYLLLDAPKLWAFVLSLFGGEARARVDAVGKEMALVAGGYVRGVAINIVLVSTITTIGLIVIGVPFALVLGVVVGLFEALPVIGSLVAGVPVMLIALLQSPTTALITFIFILIVQQVQGNIIAPNVMRDQASVPRFIVPLAILAGAGVSGVLGALIAVPFVAVLRIFVLRIAAPFIRARTGAPPVPDEEKKS
jgi:predicted PurR-regulated permease PerM